MPSKIIFEAEDQTMEEEVDTVADVKPLKVSRTSHVALKRLKKIGVVRATSCPGGSVFDNMWLSYVLTAS